MCMTDYRPVALTLDNHQTLVDIGVGGGSHQYADRKNGRDRSAWDTVSPVTPPALTRLEEQGVLRHTALPGGVVQNQVMQHD